MPLLTLDLALVEVLHLKVSLVTHRGHHRVNPQVAAIVLCAHRIQHLQAGG